AGPWDVVGDVPAGAGPGRALAAGSAVRVSTGARLPEGTTAVLRMERGTLDGNRLRPHGGSVPAAGADVRRAAGECRAGDVVAHAGDVCVPALLGLLAAAG